MRRSIDRKVTTEALSTSVTHCTAITSRLPITRATTPPTEGDAPVDAVCPNGSNTPENRVSPMVSGMLAMLAATPSTTCTSSRMPNVRQNAPRVSRHDCAAD